MTSQGRALLVASFGWLLTCSFVQADEHCSGLQLDHAIGDRLQLLNADGSNAELLPDMGGAHSLTNQFKVFDCDQKFYAVIWLKTNQPRWIKRSSVVPLDGDLVAKLCTTKEKGQFGTSGSNDKTCN